MSSMRTISRQCTCTISNMFDEICAFSSKTADVSGSVVYGVGLRLLACWDCGFESRKGHGCLSLVSVVCSQVDVSATG
jgi:hypothetical protein